MLHYNKLTMPMINVVESPVFQKTWKLTSEKRRHLEDKRADTKGARQETGNRCCVKSPPSNQAFPNELLKLFIVKAWTTVGFGGWCFCLEDQNNFS